MKIKSVILFIMTLALFSTNSYSSSSTGGSTGIGGGGDAKAIRSLILEKKRAGLQKYVVETFSDEVGGGITDMRQLLSLYISGLMIKTDPNVRIILDDMIAKGFKDDLMKTKFVMSKKCVDRFNIERTAVTNMNIPRSDICINPVRVVEEFGPYMRKSDLLALVMHEFAHHYGHEDANHLFAASVALDYQWDDGTYGL